MPLENIPVSLDAVKKAFEDFRKTKIRRGQQYPESLWQMARALLPTCTSIQIYLALGISHDLCHKHVLQKPIKRKLKPQRFISLSIPAAPKVIAKTTLPNGLVLEFLCPAALGTLMRVPHAATHATL